MTDSHAISHKRILIVDDSDQVSEAIQSTLAHLGHEVETASDAKEALRKFDPGKYDLVITDFAMPKTNGIELATSIRKKAPKQLVMMVTAYAFSLAASDGRELPVDHILQKPFSPDDIETAVNEVFNPARRPACNTPH